MFGEIIAKSVIESCVYLMTLYDLLSCGCSVWQIYDGFYGRNKTTEDTKFVVNTYENGAPAYSGSAGMFQIKPRNRPNFQTRLPVFG